MLDLLESTCVGKEGRLGLDVMLNTWTENAATFQAFGRHVHGSARNSGVTLI